MQGNHLVKECRKRAGLTQAQLAERMGTTQSAIARLERGVGEPTLKRLSDVATACGLDLQVRLVDADDHDLSLVRTRQRLSPDERSWANEQFIRFVVAGRAALAEARAAS